MTSIESVPNESRMNISILNSRHSIGIHGYLLVYSVTSRQSLEMVKIIRDKILNHTVFLCPFDNFNAQGTEWVPICVVGNKTDLHEQR